MKRFIINALFILFPVLIFAQNNKLNVGDLNAPKIEWDSEYYDFGEIKQGEPVTIYFELTNIGNAPLIISGVEASCDCTASEYQKSPIMPGQKTKIGATYDAKALGTFTKSLTVTSNATPSIVTLRFEGEVIE